MTFIYTIKGMIFLKKWMLGALLLLAAVTLSACSEPEEEDTPTFELNTNLTDANLLQTVEYEGRDFLRDGIGVVELVRCIDGDTTRFRVPSGAEFSVRYLGIDTPESTGRIEPWGRAASEFVCDALTNAHTIVLQRDAQAGNIDSTGTRQLAYVWYDGRLINLEVIELAFSPAQGTGNLMHGQLMFEAMMNARQTGRRIWGEEDPDFDPTPVVTTLAEILATPEDYMDRFVTVEGIIISTSGTNFTISDGTNQLFVFTQFQPTSRVAVGHRVLLREVVFTEHTTGLQLTNFSPQRTDVLEVDAKFD